MLGLVLQAALLGPAHPATRDPVTLNFIGAEIDEVSRTVGLILGRSILVDPRVHGKLNLVTDEPVTPSEAYGRFGTALRGLGFAIVQSNGLLKIVPEADAKTMGDAARPDPLSRRADVVATRIFRVVHENAGNLVPVLRPLISPNNTLNVNAGTNSLVVTDYLSNLARIEALLAELDIPSTTDVELVPLQHTVATDLAPLLRSLLEGSSTTGASAGAAAASQAAPAAASGAASPTMVVPDPSSNALLVKAPNAVRLAAVRQLIARLDVPRSTGAGGSNVHVIHLRNTDAVRLAAVLRAAFPVDSSRRDGSASPSTGTASAGAAGSTLPASAQGAASTSSSTASAASASAVSAVAQPSVGGFIQADPASNALIVTAPQPLYQQVRAVVEHLDIRRAQLYVESLVVEIDASKTLDVGIQWKELFGLSTSATADLTLGTVAQAIESMSGSNILSTANLMTLDNEEARIIVGQNVPMVTGSYTTSSSSSNPYQTIERKDVGVTLRIRPQIGEDGTVRMTIYQETSSVSSTTTPGTTDAGPTLNKRSIESTVVVQQGRIVVLGGLIEDSYTSDAVRIPWLGELPLLGKLFSSWSRSRAKTNLLVFLRPVVLRDDGAPSAVAQDRYEMLKARARELPEDTREILSGEGVPRLDDTPFKASP
ncbi:MAG: secretin N-terminal domain-containing protein [Pseudorhodoferax sp.]